MSPRAQQQVKVFDVENRLAKLARQPGGLTLDEAVRAAEHRLDSIRDRCVDRLGERAAELAQEAEAQRAAGRAGETACFEKLYRIANAIYGVAAPFELKGMAEVAAGLCDLIDGFRRGEPVNWEAVDVHVDGVRLLAVGGEQHAEPIFEGLRKVRSRVAG
jgi:hypothetical protein